MPDTPDIKVRFSESGETQVAAAIQHLTEKLTQLKAEQQKTRESAISLQSAFAAIVETQLAEKFVEFGKEALATAVKIGKLADATGASAKTLSVLAMAADDVGISNEQLQKGIVKLAQAFYGLEQGKAKSVVSFKLLGLSAKNFVGLNTDQKIMKVADAFAKAGPSLDKVAVMTSIFGKAGADLLPLLERLGSEGFDKLTKKAEMFGLELSKDDVAAAQQAAIAFKELENVAKGAATQFTLGLVPAITNAADVLTTQLTGEAGAAAWKEWGGHAGDAIKQVILGFVTLGAYAAAEIQSEIERADFYWQHFKEAGKTAWESIKGFATSGMPAVVTKKPSEAETSDELEVKLNAIQAKLLETVVTTMNKLNAKARDTKPVVPPGNTPVPPDLAAIAAKQAADRAALASELKTLQAAAAQKAELYRDQYALGLISLEEYFRHRKIALDDATNEEINTLTKEMHVVAAMKPKDEQAAITQGKAVKELQDQIARAAIANGTGQMKLDREHETEVENNQKKRLDFEATIAEAQGRTYDASLLRIQGEVIAMRAALAASGMTPDEIAKMQADFVAAKTQQAQFIAEEKQGATELKILAGETAIEQQKVTDHIESQVTATRNIVALDRQHLPDLVQIAATMKAEAGDNEVLQAKAAEFALQVARIKQAITDGASEWKKFRTTAEKAIGQDFVNFFTTGIQQAKSFGDAMTSLADSVVASIQRIVTEMLVQIATQKILKAMASSSSEGGDSGGGGGIFSFLASLFGGGGGGGSDGGGVTAFSPNALGGLIPGTGTTDSYPAMLMPGEFVVRAEAVRSLGLATMAAINQGIMLPNIARGALIPHFASGGLVQHNIGTRSTMDLSLQLGLEEGIVVKHLSSPSAGRVIVQQIGSNSKATGRVLQR